MAIASIPLIFPGRFVNGIYERTDLLVACDLFFAFVIESPVSFQLGDVFLAADDTCLPVYIALSED